MKKPKTIAENKNYKAISIGSFDKISEYQFLHPRLKHFVEGKVFIGEILGATGSEVSFNQLPAKTTISFLHKHTVHEELYIFLKGEGLFQADGDVFEIAEGSIVKVAPQSERTLCNNSEEPMHYIVVQSRSNTLAGYNILDGERVTGEIKI